MGWGIFHPHQDNNMLIESHLKRPHPPLLHMKDANYQFVVNEHGHHVCDITDEEVIRRLTQDIPEGYRKYVAPGAKKGKPVKTAPIAPPPLLLTNGEQQIDLRTLDRAALVALATDEFGLTVADDADLDALRQQILDAAAE